MQKKELNPPYMDPCVVPWRVHTYINVHLYALEREVRNTEGVGGRIKDTPHQGTLYCTVPQK